MVFVALGLLVGNRVLDLVEADAANQYVRLPGRGHPGPGAVHRRRPGQPGTGCGARPLVPARLLGIGLPLTIVAGTLAGLALFARAGPVDGGRPGHHAGPDRRRPRAAGGQQPAPALAHPPGPQRRERPERRRLRPAADHLPHPRRRPRRAPADLEPVRVVLEEIGFGAVGGVVAGALGAWVLRGFAARGWMEGTWKQINARGHAAAGLHGRRRPRGQRVHRRLRRRDHLRRRRPRAGRGRPPTWPSSPGSC